MRLLIALLNWYTNKKPMEHPRTSCTQIPIFMYKSSLKLKTCVNQVLPSLDRGNSMQIHWWRMGWEARQMHILWTTRRIYDSSFPKCSQPKGTSGPFSRHRHCILCSGVLLEVLLFCSGCSMTISRYSNRWSNSGHFSIVSLFFLCTSLRILELVQREVGKHRGSRWGTSW